MAEQSTTLQLRQPGGGGGREKLVFAGRVAIFNNGLHRVYLRFGQAGTVGELGTQGTKGDNSETSN